MSIDGIISLNDSFLMGCEVEIIDNDKFEKGVMVYAYRVVEQNVCFGVVLYSNGKVVERTKNEVKIYFKQIKSKQLKKVDLLDIDENNG